MGHVFSHRSGWENIDTKFCYDRILFCLSLNWILFCYDRTRFLLLHLTIGEQAGHLTSALHRRTAAQAALHGAAHRQYGPVWYMYLKTENCYLKTFVEIRVGEKVR